MEDLTTFLSGFIPALIGYCIGCFVCSTGNKGGFRKFPGHRNPPTPPIPKIDMNLDVQPYIWSIGSILLEDIIYMIGQWSEETFKKQSSVSKLKHLQKEVVELIEECEKDRNDALTSININLEFADCFILLLDAARKEGLNAEDILITIAHKMKINKERKWGPPDKDGVVQHIREETI